MNGGCLQDLAVVHNDNVIAVIENMLHIMRYDQYSFLHLLVEIHKQLHH